MNQLIFCPLCSLSTFLRPLYLVRWNDVGDDLFECLNVACGYMAAYRARTGQFEPPAGQPSAGWQPPLGWQRPQRIDSAGPLATEDSPSPIVEAAQGMFSADQHDTTQSAGAELTADVRVATSIEAAAAPDTGDTHDDAADMVAQQSQNVALGNASTDPAAEAIDDNPRAAIDAGAVPGRDAANPAQRGQDRPRGRADQTIAHVRRLHAQMGKLRAHPDLDPIRRARALGQLAHEALQAIDFDSRLAAETQHRTSLDRSAIRKRERTIADLRRLLAQEMKKLQTHPDLDPVSKAQAGARLAREARRAIQLQGRVADTLRTLFDFAAMIEELRREPTIKDPRIEIEERLESGIRPCASPADPTAIGNEPKIAKQFLAGPSGS